MHPSQATPWETVWRQYLTRPHLDTATNRDRRACAHRAGPANHALTAGIDPSLLGNPENGLANPSPVPALEHGKGALGHRGWAGPLPPRSHGPHTYVFQLFALDYRPDLSEKFTLTDALDAMTGHVSARARLDGTYENQ